MREMPIKVLLVENNPADAELIQHMLTQANRKGANASSFGLERADHLSTALERLAAGGIDVVLLDLSLPDSQGLMAFSAVHSQATHVPVIVLSGIDDEALAIEAVSQGAQDYLVKGHVDGFSPVRAIRNAIERKQAESQREAALEALRRERDFTFAVLDTLSALVIVLDPEGRIVRFNHACEEMTGYSADDVIGKYMWDLLLLPEEVEPVKVVFESLLTGVLCNQYENYWVAEDGERRLIAWSNTTIRDQQGRVEYVVGTGVDVTETTRAEEDLEKAKEIAEAATRAKSEFLANMSHEIRTPMNVIIGMTSLALKTDLVSEQRDYLNAVRNSSESLLGLLNDILDFSKIEAGRLELEETAFKLQEVTEQTADIVAQRASEKGLELVFHIHPEVPVHLRGDPLRFRQVLVNLVGNAIKFTEQGEIVVQISLSAEGDDTVELLCSVTDTGIGIPAEKLSLIFDSFSQADGSTTRRYGGTGLGLAISKQLVRMMGGSIWVESEVEHGSTFYFTALLKREPNPQESVPVEAVSIQDWRALVIDDNAHNRHILHEALRSFGCRPEMARDGAEGLWMLERALETGDPFELVLLDVQMPGMDGFEALQVIRQTPQLQSLVVIMLTSVDSLGKVANCPELGWSAYLTKPVKQSQLLDTIVDAIGRSAVANKSVQLQPEKRLSPSAVPLRILLAEDNDLNAHLAKVLLENAGHQVVPAQNGEAALDLLAREDFDMVFMDVQMPVMDGFETTAAIRGNPAWAHLPIIAMTAHAMKGDRERCLEAGMNDYVSKPLRMDEVLAAIERQLEPGEDQKSRGPATGDTSDGGPTSAILDRTGALSRLGGDEAMFNEFLLLLLDGAESDVAELAVAVEADDAVGIERLAHGLKGGAASLGADRVRDAAYRLEIMGRSGDLADARPALARLREELSLLRGLIGDRSRV